MAARQGRTRLGISGYTQKPYGDFQKEEQVGGRPKNRRHAAYANRKRKRPC